MDLRKNYSELEILGNINFHLGVLFLILHKESKADNYFNLAKGYFKKVLPKNHQVFKEFKQRMK